MDEAFLVLIVIKGSMDALGIDALLHQKEAVVTSAERKTFPPCVTSIPYPQSIPLRAQAATFAISVCTHFESLIYKHTISPTCE